MDDEGETVRTKWIAVDPVDVQMMSSSEEDDEEQVEEELESEPTDLIDMTSSENTSDSELDELGDDPGMKSQP